MEVSTQIDHSNNHQDEQARGTRISKTSSWKDVTIRPWSDTRSETDVELTFKHDKKKSGGIVELDEMHFLTVIMNHRRQGVIG